MKKLALLFIPYRENFLRLKRYESWFIHHSWILAEDAPLEAPVSDEARERNPARFLVR